MTHCGFQATNLALAIEEVNKMLHQRSVPLIEDQIDQMEEDEFIKRKSHCTIFLGYTSNMVSSGIREVIRFLVQHKLVNLYTQDLCFYSASYILYDFINNMFVGRLPCYYSRWSRRRFHQMFSTYICW